MKRFALLSLLLLLFVSGCINDRRLAERIPPVRTSDLLLDRNKVGPNLASKLGETLFAYSTKERQRKAWTEVEFVGVEFDPFLGPGMRDSYALQSVTRYINPTAAAHHTNLYVQKEERLRKSMRRADSLWAYTSPYADIWFLYCFQGVNFNCDVYAQYDEFTVWFTSSSGESFKSLTEDDIKILIRAIDEHVGKSLSTSRIEYRLTVTWEPRPMPTTTPRLIQTTSP